MNIMNPDDYADLCGDGHQNEMQRCLAEARHGIPRVSEAELNALFSRGLLVVVEYGAVYCRSTDALAGEGTVILFTAGTREGARAELVRRYEAGTICDDGETRYEVLPRLPVVREVVRATADECPF